jgi:protein-arginine kinase activator protein McsA
MGKMKKHGDIIFLERRLQELVDKEYYEKAATIKRWIDELTILFEKRSKEKINILDDSINDQ